MNWTRPVCPTGSTKNRTLVRSNKKPQNRSKAVKTGKKNRVELEAGIKTIFCCSSFKTMINFITNDPSYFRSSCTYINMFITIALSNHFLFYFFKILCRWIGN